MLSRVLTFLLFLILLVWTTFKLSINILPERLLSAVVTSTLVELSNESRRESDLKQLKLSQMLAEAARLKAEDMAYRGYFSHTDPEGILPWFWFEQVGYDYKYAGENLAINFSESKEVMTAWLSSPAHRANILNNKYSEIGIGVAEGFYQGEKAIFIVQFFAAPTKAQAAKSTGQFNRITGAVVNAGLWSFGTGFEKDILERLLNDSFGRAPIILP